MRKLNKIRYLITKGNSFYWQPSTMLRAVGWDSVRLSDNLREARNQAEDLNEQLDAWRLSAESLQAQSKKMRERTLNDLIDNYLEDIAFLKRTKDTKKSYRQRIKTIREWGGDVPLSAITSESVNTLYNALSAKSLHKGNAVIRVLRLILGFGVKPLKWLPENPASCPGLEATQPRDRFCSYQEQKVFVETADEMGLQSIGNAFLCGLYIGQREADILKLDGFSFQNNTFLVKQNKTSRWVSVPAAKPLKERLEKMHIQPNQNLIITEATGVPYSDSYFRHKFGLVRKEAAKKLPEIKTLQFMDLRRTAVVRMGNAGCTEYQIAAVTGHKIDTCRKILETYLPRTDKMAADAIKKYELEEEAA